ncbi:MAG: hypothetical protein JRF59_04830 [Deltaproteobacteria bacterium]|nr:hypothetical protein [Deltaproteobacteria bacterium]MBW2347151.1 hypothetical protein [Deltaproteobacteria bacterium]RLB40488.1 MAG: hypothetical protein DRH20_01295 [Deltaproteobacteria bacterium]
MSVLSEIQSSSTAGTIGSSAVNKSTLGRDDFLKIFLAQVSHQDPLNPMEATEFTAQLAQFSSLEQLFNLNKNVESMKEAQSDSSRFQALSLLGREILAEGDTLDLEEGSIATGAFNLPEQADCTVLVKDRYGNIVRRIRLGPLGEGPQAFQWDGLNDAGARADAGTYSFEIEAVGDQGHAVLADPMIRGRVSRVSLEGAEPVLYAGQIPVRLSQVLDVRQTEARDDAGPEETGQDDPDISV